MLLGEGILRSWFRTRDLREFLVKEFCEIVWGAWVGIWERLGNLGGSTPERVSSPSSGRWFYIGSLGYWRKIYNNFSWRFFEEYLMAFSILLDLGKGEEEGATTTSFGLLSTRPDKLSRGWGLPLSKGGKALVLAVFTLWKHKSKREIIVAFNSK